jgi:hypothetical protein
MRIIITILLCMAFMLSVPAQSKPGKPKKRKGSPSASRLTPEQQDLKKTASYLTDGRQFSDDEIIELSRILKKLEFSRKWKDIKNKAEGNYPLSVGEKRIYKKILKRQNKVRRQLDKYWEKKNRPKNKEELKRYKANKKKSDKWNRKKMK